MDTERYSSCFSYSSFKSPRRIYRLMFTDFFSRLSVVAFGLAFAITRLTYGLVEANTTLCVLDKNAAIFLVLKGSLELVMFWAPLVVFKSCKKVAGASANPCFEIHVYIFAATEFVLLVLEIVWCLGYYYETKTTCPLTDPNWSAHFANFGISQTVIDGITWIGTIFALGFLMFDQKYKTICDEKEKTTCEESM